MESGRASAKTTGVNPATGKKEGGSGPLFRELSDPSYTVMSSPRDVLLDTAEKPVKIRSLTLPETLVLQGFNPDYDLSAARTMKSRWTMVGNAVPPPVAEAVIRGIENAAPN
jgi:site-specific DNA-cytosine methylase